MNTVAVDANERRRTDPPNRIESSAFAFATDPGTERALREGLADLDDAQVWPGSLRAAAAALREQDRSPQFLFVDLDEAPYPGGGIYELSAVCEVDTVVVALGSDDTARFTREVLLAGVRDYLVKPITAAAVREAVARATASTATHTDQGWLVGFAGTGGTGATTLAAAVTLLAAERGRYVSVLDLNRTFSALSFVLDVEPASGLVDLLSTAARASLHPDLIDGMRAQRSSRIAVFGYPSGVELAPLAPVWAVCELLVELQRRSHLVIVDGMDDPAIRQTLLAMVDARVVVVEPTRVGAIAAARMLTRLGPMRGRDWPMVLVQNHTRAFEIGAGADALGRAGITAAPDVVVPFEPTLPSIADRGWPGDRLPRTLRAPLTRLADRILAMSGSSEQREPETRGLAGEPATSDIASPPDARSDSSEGSAARPRPSLARSVLRRLLPRRTAALHTAREV